MQIANTLKMARYNTSNGFSLLELLLVVAVGAVLILAGLGAYRLVTTNANTNDTKRQLVQIKSEAQRVYASQGTYTGLTTATAAAAGIFSGIKGGDTGAPVTPFGFAYAIAAAGTGNFTITLNDLPSSACSDNATMFVGNADFVSGGVGKTTGKTTTADLRALCTSTASANDLVLTFK
jgi:prepilin-type N-terminal cleavage/methylation domain-containing protein